MDLEFARARNHLDISNSGSDGVCIMMALAFGIRHYLSLNISILRAGNREHLSHFTFQYNKDQAKNKQIIFL